MSELLPGLTTDAALETALQTIMPFGKYKGWKLREIVHREPAYLAWLMDRKNVPAWQSGRLRTAVGLVYEANRGRIGEAVRTAEQLAR